MQAVLVAGGKGKRLQPYTLTIPKPLIPIGSEPIMEVIIRQLIKYGFSKIHVCIGYMGELIQSYFGDGSKYKVAITYSSETKPLGTVGPIALVESLDEHFIVMNGDTLCDIDYGSFLKQHSISGCPLTIATYAKKVKIELGVMEFDPSKKLKAYIEKPTLQYNVSTGIYAMSRDILPLIPKNEYFDFPTLVKLLLEKKIGVQTIEHKGIWHDLGSIESFESAIEDYNRFNRFNG
jgi:NDP-sugar pyrophosphorylase family protein